jgi:Amt family ammonium transporter
VAGIISVLGAILLERWRLDDMVGAVAVHGFSGAWGTLAAGLFYHGDLFNLQRITVQLVGIAACFIWTFPLALATYWIISQIVGLRADTLHEQRGLDFTEHYEVGYPEFQRDLTHAGKG